MLNNLLQQAIREFQSGNFSEAAALAKKLSELSPASPDILHLEAAIFLKANNLDEAEKKARKAISLQKNNPNFHNTLGLILREKKQYKEAIGAHEKAIGLAPQAPDFYNNAGLACQELRDYDKAFSYYDKALGENSNFPEAHMNIGALLSRLKRPQEALPALETALALRPSDPLILYNLSVTYKALFDYEKAVECVRAALKINPDFFKAEVNLCECLHLYGNYENARKGYEELIKKYPEKLVLKIQDALLFPHVTESNAHIDMIRADFYRKLEALAAEGFKIEDIFNEPVTIPFYQGYHGRNNKELMEKLSGFLRTISPDLNYIAANAGRKLSPGKRPVRIGFVSQFFYKHAVSSFSNNVLEALAGYPEFEVLAFTASPKSDAVTDKLKSKIKEFIVMPYDLPAAQKIISKKEPDILVYIDIGMDILTYLLAYSRLAPKQCVMAGGHPITTGLSTIDYSLSGAMLEPENASEHYTEKLILFKHSMPEIFSAPKVPETRRTRSELGLPEDMRLYICPVQPFRIHPDMDEIFREILERDEKALLILVEGDFKNLWRGQLEERLRKTIPDELRQRIKFIPFARGDDFFHLLYNMDALLDPLHFALGTTLFSIFAAGLPLVTLEGEFMRGRIASGYYRQMGVTDLIAKTKEEYVNLAIKLAGNKEFHGDIAARIKANSHILFDDYRVMEELRSFFIGLVDKP